jgi:cell division protein FtsI/penicillin-binding protein 2
MKGTTSGRTWRVWAVMTMMALIALVVIVRLVLLQVTSHQQLAQMATETQYQIVDVEPWRGQIFDRDGVALAVNEVQYSIGASPGMITDTYVVADRLAPLLNMPRAGIQAQIEVTGTQWVPLASRVSKTIGEAIRDLHFSGLVVSAVQHRIYPQGTLAAHALGFVALGDGQGYYGVEAFYEHKLAGEHVTDEVSLSPLDVPTTVQPRPGVDLYLTIDREVQFATEQALARALQDTGAPSGTIIVMDPRTGAILAMASLPTYDPNQTPTQVPDPSRINPAISSQYEPGSVFKILTMAIALQSGTVTPESTYYDGGAINVGGVVIQNWNRGAWGVQDMTGLLAHSLNVGAATLSTWMGPETFYRGLRLFHLGETLTVDMVGEGTGQLRLPGDEDWHESDLGTNAFGQGVAVTPLQMIATAAVVANGGEMMRPHVVAAEVRNGVRVDVKPEPIARPISPEVAAMLTQMLTSSIAREADNAEVPGYTIAGKTGTAQVVRPGGYYDPDATIASFLGFLPASDPRLIILVKLDEPQSSPWGSRVASPVFAQLASQLVVLLEIPPDNVRAKLGN